MSASVTVDTSAAPLTSAKDSHIPFALPEPILVTGGSGFLGINLIRWLLAHGAPDVRSIDLLPFDYPEATDSRVHTVIGDVRDPVAVKSRRNIVAVYRKRRDGKCLVCDSDPYRDK
jgi:uncharacterized protein YbjT (DUF2867 family)